MAATKKTKIDEESDEDKELKEDLKRLVEKIQGKNEKLHLPALDMLRYLIRTATTSMTSVPKPLKYLAEYYSVIKTCHTIIKDEHTRKVCADIISVLAMSAADSENAKTDRDCLNYCLIGTMTDIGDWGHEYVRQLENEIVEEWTTNPEKIDQLFPLVHKIVEFDSRHHAEIQACDLLMEIDQLDLLAQHITDDTYQRICLYLASCASYVDEIESVKTLKFVLKQYTKYREYTKALIIAMQLRDDELINKIFGLCKDLSALKQMSFIAGRQQINVKFLDDLQEKEDLENITFNSNLSSLFHLLGRELDIMEPKTPEEIYKSWLESTLIRPSLLTENLDSARMNLATSFVNAFVNAAFGQDKLVTTDQGSRWIYRNKDHAMLSATASLGLIYLWDVDGGLSPIDKYLYTNDTNIKAGALLAIGIVNCRVKNECDPALALLSSYVQHDCSALQVGAIFGLGLAYAGTHRQDVLNLLIPVILSKASNEVVTVASMSCGLIAVSSCNSEVSTAILQKLIESKGTTLVTTSFSKLMVLGLGLCYLGCRDATEAPSAALEVFEEPFRSLSQTMLKMCAYAGTGDVLVVQEFLHICSERYEAPPAPAKVEPSKTGSNPKQHFKKTGNAANTKNKIKDKEKPCVNDFCSVQGMAALGVGLVSMGETIGREMSSRIFGHMAQYGDACMRKTVPLTMALCSVSNPQLSIIDVLNKYSHDVDDEVSCNAIFGMGLVGAGTNNARLATMLRQLAVYHNRNPAQLFMVRIAQGLVHLGKGTLTLNPFHTDKQLFCTTALGGLLITLVALLDVPYVIYGKSHYLLYSLVAAMQPRWLVTLDENLNQISVPVRVGQAVDVVAKAGTPKIIAGIHTHSTPVLLAVGERAELATDQYEQLSPIMEGIVILRKNTE